MLVRYISFLLWVLTLPLHAISITNGMTHDFTCQPGETLEGTISVMNPKNTPIRVLWEQTDYYFNYKGRNTFESPGSHPRSNGKWITLHTPSKFDIGPNGKSNIKYTIHVPEGEKLDGTYWSMVFLEEIEIQPEAPMEKHVRVNTKVRYGVQLVCEIGETGEADLRVIHQEIIEKDGKRLLNMGVENVGNRKTRAGGQLTLFSKKGDKLKEVSGSQANIYPGCSFMYQFDLGDVPKGDYQSLVVFEGKSDDIFGVMKDLTIE